MEVSGETLGLTTLSDWTEGRRVNLERAARVGDELGGHIVTGHVDAVAVIAAVAPEGDSLRLTLDAGPEVAPYIAPKGSVALDGVFHFLRHPLHRLGLVDEP